MIPTLPPPISYCRACGNDEYHINRSGNGWGDLWQTICRACLKHKELDDRFKRQDNLIHPVTSDGKGEE